MAVEEVVVIPAGHPNMMQGDVERFDEAVQRRECPYRAIAAGTNSRHA
jgi:hypothetical protein